MADTIREVMTQNPTTVDASATIQDARRAVALDVTVGRARAALRVWRGTRPGSYDAYAKNPGAYWIKWAESIESGKYDYFKP